MQARLRGAVYVGVSLAAVRSASDQLAEAAVGIPGILLVFVFAAGLALSEGVRIASRTFSWGKKQQNIAIPFVGQFQYLSLLQLEIKNH